MCVPCPFMLYLEWAAASERGLTLWLVTKQLSSVGINAAGVSLRQAQISARHRQAVQFECCVHAGTIMRVVFLLGVLMCAVAFSTVADAERSVHTDGRRSREQTPLPPRTPTHPHTVYRLYMIV